MNETPIIDIIAEIEWRIDGIKTLSKHIEVLGQTNKDYATSKDYKEIFDELCLANGRLIWADTLMREFLS